MRYPLSGRHRRAPGPELDPEPAPSEFQTTADLQKHLMECRRRPGHCIVVVLAGLVLLILASIVTQL